MMKYDIIIAVLVKKNYSQKEKIRILEEKCSNLGAADERENSLYVFRQ